VAADVGLGATAVSATGSSFLSVAAGRVAFALVTPINLNANVAYEL